MEKIDLTSAAKEVQKKRASKEVVAVIPCPTPVIVPDNMQGGRAPDGMWEYQLSTGETVGAIARWDARDGKDKVIRPIIWDGKRFMSGGFPIPRPLYNCPMISAAPTAPVLVVEGERSVDGAMRYVTDGFLVTTWPNGASNWHYADWSLLADRDVVIWPDNDEPGTKCANELSAHLRSLGARTSIVDVHKFPEKWDLADELPFGKPSMIMQLIRNARAKCEGNPQPVATPEPEAVLPVTKNDEELAKLAEDSFIRYRAIGYNEQKYYVLSATQRQPYAYTVMQLMSEQHCLEIVNDASYWQKHFADEKGRVNWRQAGAFIMKQCTDAGIYKPDKVREQGVWIDQGRTVLHFGEKIFVDGAEVNPAKFRSSFTYPSRDNMLEEWHGIHDAAPDGYGRAIRAACRAVRWEKEIYGDLLAGWIATAIVCGGLPWRTHAWITANASSGKSTVIEEIVAACLGGIAIYPVGASTEAGIRQFIGNQAVPVVFDEAEGNGNTEERRQAVIQLMRQSSAETRGRIMKGSANHQSVSFTLRSAFLMSSIGVGLREAADLTRTAVLSIKPLAAVTTAERVAQEEQWRKLQAACAAIPTDTPQKLLSRQVGQLPLLRKNIEVFKEVIAVNLGNRRLGDQLGTLIAGMTSLFSKAEVSYQGCEKFLEGYDWADFTKVKTLREDLALLYHLANYRVKVDSTVGSYERLIGELIETALTEMDDGIVNPVVATNTLLRLGIRIDKKEGGIWIATGLSGIKQIMAKSDYNEGWSRVLERHPYAKPSAGTIKFSGVSSRAVFIPQQEFFKIEG